MIAVVVTYPPGGKSMPHHHAASAFIYAHALSGAIRSQVDDQPAKVYRAGEGFYEVQGSHHTISENASDTEPASLLAVFVVDSADSPLIRPDKKQAREYQPCSGSHGQCRTVTCKSFPGHAIANTIR
jgi:quercetin dioxygenase-like cupin family protein